MVEALARAGTFAVCTVAVYVQASVAGQEAGGRVPDPGPALLVFTADGGWSPRCVALDRSLEGGEGSERFLEAIAGEFPVRRVALPLRAPADDPAGPGEARALARAHGMDEVPALVFVDVEGRPLLALRRFDAGRLDGLVADAQRARDARRDRERVLAAALDVPGAARVERLDGLLRQMDPVRVHRWFAEEVDALLAVREGLDPKLVEVQRRYRLGRAAFQQREAWETLRDSVRDALREGTAPRALDGLVLRFVEVQKPGPDLLQQVYLLRSRLALLAHDRARSLAHLRALVAVEPRSDLARAVQSTLE